MANTRITTRLVRMKNYHMIKQRFLFGRSNAKLSYGWTKILFGLSNEKLLLGKGKTPLHSVQWLFPTWSNKSPYIFGLMVTKNLVKQRHLHVWSNDCSTLGQKKCSFLVGPIGSLHLHASNIQPNPNLTLI